MALTPEQLQAEIEKASEFFTEMCQNRHILGAEKYGALNFLQVNTIEEALFELADLANYARYTFIKLILLNQWADETLAVQEINIGASAFQPNHPRDE